MVSVIEILLNHREHDLETVGSTMICRAQGLPKRETKGKEQEALNGNWIVRGYREH